MKNIFLIACATLALAACSPETDKSKESAAVAAPIKPIATDLPAGAYKLDKSHASLIFRVNHLGFSQYTSRFSTFDIQMELDPANPTAASLEATIDVTSLGLENPPPGFTETLLGPEWLDAGQFPTMTFRSTAVELTGPSTARITGDFTLHGVTKPIALNATFNGGYVGHPLDPNARIGFSATGVLKRSEFGVAYGIPEPGTTMGVSDEVSVMIEAELTGPPLPPG